MVYKKHAHDLFSKVVVTLRIYAISLFRKLYSYFISNLVIRGFDHNELHFYTYTCYILVLYAINR
ncbi:hypothetical protein HanRHA438_Chr12g0536791 [Helianthus annuus]|nr:hypothetical protein HanIR_Chr12g0565871 [Helianthus annuus]KAJ0865086.1 hypothetical protein HanRHA438_Chr12g0536791 [Helianthus annuus]